MFDEQIKKKKNLEPMRTFFFTTTIISSDCLSYWTALQNLLPQLFEKYASEC